MSGLGAIPHKHPGVDFDAHMDENDDIIIDRWGGPGKKPTKAETRQWKTEYAAHLAAEAPKQAREKMIRQEPGLLAAILDCIEANKAVLTISDELQAYIDKVHS